MKKSISSCATHTDMSEPCTMSGNAYCGQVSVPPAIALREWRGTSRKSKVLIGLGLTVLILSTIVVSYGNFLQGKLTT